MLSLKMTIIANLKNINFKSWVIVGRKHFDSHIEALKMLIV